MPERRQSGAGMAEKDLPVAGNANAAPVTFEDGNAKRLFQLANRLRYGGLADIEQTCRLDHAFLACNLDKGLQMAEFDARVEHAHS